MNWKFIYKETKFTFMLQRCNVLSVFGQWQLLDLDFRTTHRNFPPELMQSMFSDSKIAASLSMRSSKLFYVISHGTGHYFTMELIKDVRKTKAFSLLFDESTTTGVRKQCDLHFRYWSATKNAVCTRYYKSIFLGHATADILSRETIDSLKADGIDIAHLLLLGKFLVPYLN